MRAESVRSFYCRTALVVPLLLAACSQGAANRPAGAAPAEAKRVEASVAATPTTGQASGAAGQAAGAGIAATQAPSIAQAPAGQAAAPATAPRQAIDPATLRIVLDPLPAQLDRPVYATHAGDGSGRLFVVEKPGRIVVLRDGQASPAPFLDIRDRVGSSGSEQGLLGLAFHPKYTENGRFVVNYTDRNGDTAIVEFRANGDGSQADASTARPILAIDQPAPNHNGGNVVFGPDGYLWIGMGDGGGAGDRYGNGQNRQALLGKMLRIDLDSGDPYGIPADNPFVGASDARPEIWATGLRNPWRYSFDRATNDLWIADVGQNAYEEVHVQRSDSRGGENYGWPLMEGMHCFPQGRSCDTAPFVMPVGEYARDGGCSVTGGYVYRGSRFPQLAGLYLFGDFCTGKLWSLDEPAPGAWRMVELLDSNLQMSSFGEDEAGELYIASLHDNRLHRVMVGQ